MTRTLWKALLTITVLFSNVPPAAAQTDPHAGHAPTAPASREQEKRGEELPAFIPKLTDADRQAAFPDVEGHAVHDRGIHYFVLFDQLEWQAVSHANVFNLDASGWIGGDRNRLRFRAEGDADESDVGDAQVHVLYGRQFARWWDFVAGIRQDFAPGPAQTWAAVGVQGLAPYWFDIEATAYIGSSGRTHLRLEAEYELLLTNRLVLQPLIEAEIFGKADPSRGVGAGLSTTDAGLRVRYEFRRELAPYVGITWRNAWGQTSDFAEAAGEDRSGARFTTGMRLWF